MSIAELTNQNGNTYNFKTDSISVVNQAPGNSGSSTTMVWSIFGHPQEVTDAPQSVLSRYNLTAKFIRLTSPGGELWVKPASVSAIHAPFPGDKVQGGARCVLFVDGTTFTSIEDVDTVKRMLMVFEKSTIPASATLARRPKAKTQFAKRKPKRT
jgi:hypothetical protein